MPKNKKPIINIGRDKEMYQRMEGIRASGAAGIHADQNRRKDTKSARRNAKQEERNQRENE